jgi:pantoate--beta-alanine ligase
MGALHAGHASLIRASRAECDFTVVSIFVNPSQFGAGEDFSRYPRTFDVDRELCAAMGTDLIFAPMAGEMYPPESRTVVEVVGLQDALCGQSRPGHFRGVATVVLKLFHIVQPDAAYFGQKDAQQALVIRKLARDLDIPVRIEVCPTVRDPDGLALSSRNAYLSEAEREQALSLSRSLRAAEGVVAGGELDAVAVLAAARQELDDAGLEPEYLELRSTTDLSPVERVNGSTLLAVAARVGKARLIDNTILGGDK